MNAKYNKLWSGIVGGAVGILASILVYMGFATESAGCADPAAGPCVVTIFGMSATMIQSAVIQVLTLIGVVGGPANTQ